MDSDLLRRAAARDSSTEFDEQYMRMPLRFDTGAASYRWLNESLWLAEGRLDSGWIEYVVYRSRDARPLRLLCFAWSHRLSRVGGDPPGVVQLIHLRGLVLVR